MPIQMEVAYNVASSRTK